MARKDEASEPKTGFDSWKQSADTDTRKKKNRKAAHSADAKTNGARRGSQRKRKMPAAMRRHAFTLVALVVLLAVCAVGFYPPAERITQGLDIQGGVSVILTASKTDGSQPTGDEMATATSIVQRRVNSLGASEATVQQQGTNSIL
ncbi:MAG: protein translocase subunit SecD, partial [Olegusella sp.]|nr:protein translocase subunit SecD [Olegusella sp.]